MQYTHVGRRWRVAIIAALAMLALASWATVSAQTQPPLRVYGSGEAGDQIAVLDQAGQELGATRVTNSGEWHVDIECHADKAHMLSFSVNGEPVAFKISNTGADQASITFLGRGGSGGADSMTEDDSLMEDDSMGVDDSTGDDSMIEDEDSSMRDEEDSMLGGHESADETQSGAAYPDSGTGGLRDQGASTSQIALLVAAAMSGLLMLGIAFQRRRV